MRMGFEAARGWALWFVKHYDVRQDEFRVALRFLEGCARVLDLGCGRGTFLEKAPVRLTGVDLNDQNVAACTSRGLNAMVGNALDLQFEDNSFDGAYCSHLIQVFDFQNALKLLRELRRVVKPGGVVVIATFPDHKKLYFTPETHRAYPPHALRSLIKQPGDFLDPSAAPTYTNAPMLKQEDIWFRRPPLIELDFPATVITEGVGEMLNLLQYRVFLRNYLSYNGYLIKLRNGPKS